MALGYPAWAGAPILDSATGRGQTRSVSIANVRTQIRKESESQCIGGYDKIAAVVDDFLNSLRTDPQFSKFIAGLATTSRRRNRQLIVNQICELSGGPCLYIGRTMKASHEGIPISESDWEAAGKHMRAALDKVKVRQKEKEEFMALIATLKDDIVAKNDPNKD